MATLTRYSTFRSLKKDTVAKSDNTFSPKAKKITEVENFILQLRKKAKKSNKI